MLRNITNSSAARLSRPWLFIVLVASALVSCGSDENTNLAINTAAAQTAAAISHSVPKKALAPIPSQMAPTVSIATVTNMPQAGCDDTLPPRLESGQSAEIVVFQIKIRRGPGLSQNTVSPQYLARHRVVQILDGPVCEDGLWWFRAHSQDFDVKGWLAEGDEDNYYLEDASNQ